jgi:hypothetical protein
VRAAYQNAAVVATSRVRDDGTQLETSRARRDEALELARIYEKLADESR